MCICTGYREVFESAERVGQAPGRRPRLSVVHIQMDKDTPRMSRRYGKTGHPVNDDRRKTTGRPAEQSDIIVQEES